MNGPDNHLQAMAAAVLAAQSAYAGHVAMTRRADQSVATRLAAAEAEVDGHRSWADGEGMAVADAAAVAATRVPAEIAAGYAPTLPLFDRLSTDARQGLAAARRQVDVARSALDGEAGAQLLWRMRQSKLMKGAAAAVLGLIVAVGLYAGTRVVMARLAAEASVEATAAAIANPSVPRATRTAAAPTSTIETKTPSDAEALDADDEPTSVSQIVTSFTDGGVEGTVSAKQAQTATGIEVDVGQTVRVEYLEGEWRAGSPPNWPLVGPDGDQQVAEKDTLPVPDRPIAALIAGVGRARPLAVGHRLEFIAASRGDLWLGPNDDDTSDNSGQMLVRVTVGEADEELVVESTTRSSLSGSGLIQLTFAEDRDYTPTLPPTSDD